MSTQNNFSSYLKTLLDLYNKKPADLAKGLRVSGSYLTEIFRGRSKPFTMDRCEQAAVYLGLKADEKKKLISLALMERSPEEFRSILKRSFGQKQEIIQLSEDSQDYAKVPILGKCPASPKVWVADEIESWHYFPKQLVKGRRLYLLRAHGDSMNRAGIDDQDLVIVDAGKHPVNGNIVVVCIDHEYTMKRFYKSGDSVTLMPDSLNQHHSPITFDLDTCEMSLRGVVEAVHYKKLR